MEVAKPSRAGRRGGPVAGAGGAVGRAAPRGGRDAKAGGAPRLAGHRGGRSAKVGGCRTNEGVEVGGASRGAASRVKWEVGGKQSMWDAGWFS